MDADPELAIRPTREFVESIFDEREEPYGRNGDLPALMRKTTRGAAADTGPRRQHRPRCGHGQADAVEPRDTRVGSAELRNAYGTGHGKSKPQARPRITPRYTRLAVGAAAAWNGLAPFDASAEPAVRMASVPPPSDVAVWCLSRRGRIVSRYRTGRAWRPFAYLDRPYTRRFDAPLRGVLIRAEGPRGRDHRQVRAGTRATYDPD